MKANLDRATVTGATPLYIASEKGHLDVVRFLVEAGADKDKAGEDGNVVIYKIVGPPGEFLFPVGILQKDGKRMNIQADFKLMLPKIAALTVKSVAGTYKRKDKDTWKVVLLENGIVESYGNGKLTAEGKWKIVDGEIHVKDDPGDISVQRINIDGSITLIAVIVKDRESRERLELPRYGQITYKKIK